MIKYLILILFLLLSHSVSAQTKSTKNEVLIANVSKLKTLAEELSTSNRVTDILPWYIKKDKDSISQKLNLFQKDLQRSKDSVEYYLAPSFTEGGTHAIRFVYHDDTPHSSIFIQTTTGYKHNSSLSVILKPLYYPAPDPPFAYFHCDTDSNCAQKSP